MRMQRRRWHSLSYWRRSQSIRACRATRRRPKCSPPSTLSTRALAAPSRRRSCVAYSLTSAKSSPPMRVICRPNPVCLGLHNLTNTVLFMIIATSTLYYIITPTMWAAVDALLRESGVAPGAHTPVQYAELVGRLGGRQPPQSQAAAALSRGPPRWFVYFSSV